MSNTHMDRRCFLHGLSECLLPSPTDRSHETSLILSSNLHDDLQVRLLRLILTQYLHPGHLCNNTSFPLALPPSPPPPYSFSAPVWVLRGPIVSCCSPGAHSAAVGWRSLQSSPHDQVPWASGHRPPRSPEHPAVAVTAQ